jgi:hypothetical protein
MPATLPCPKIPNMPAKNWFSFPSRRTYWFFKNWMMACAAVIRIVAISFSLKEKGLFRTWREKA